MAAAMRCKHSPGGGIHWLQVKPWLVVLHGAMRPASHRRIRVVVKMVVDLPALFVSLILLLLLLATTTS